MLVIGVCLHGISLVVFWLGFMVVRLLCFKLFGFGYCFCLFAWLVFVFV